MSNRKLVWILALLAVALKPATGLADDDDQAPAEGRYFFDLLDHRSSFGKDFFIDSFLGPTLDSGTEIELDYLHGEKRGLHDDEVDTEVEWNPIGQLTIAGEFGWDSEHEQTPHAGLEGDNIDRGGEAGLEDVDIAVYHPIFQYVSKNGQVDYTAVVRVDVGIPTRGSPSSQDVLVTPFLGHMLRLGDHISLEAWTGPQITIAPHAANVLIYGACLGYVFPHKQFPSWTGRCRCRAPQENRFSASQDSISVSGESARCSRMSPSATNFPSTKARAISCAGESVCKSSSIFEQTPFDSAIPAGEIK